MNQSELDDVASAAAQAVEIADFETAARLYLAILDEPGVNAETAKSAAWNLAMIYIREGYLDSAVTLLQDHGYTEQEYAHLLAN